MKSTSKKIVALLFFVAIGTSALFSQNEQEQIQVTDAELESFAEAFQGMRVLNQRAQQQMIGVVEEGGLEIKRFNEIHTATLDPNKEVDASDEEQQKYEDIGAEIQKMQESFRTEMETVVSDAGISMERYQEIAENIQNNPELQERLKKIFETE